jgi:hypothetical protein
MLNELILEVDKESIVEATLDAEAQKALKKEMEEITLDIEKTLKQDEELDLLSLALDDLIVTIDKEEVTPAEAKMFKTATVAVLTMANIPTAVIHIDTESEDDISLDIEGIKEFASKAKVAAKKLWIKFKNMVMKFFLKVSKYIAPTAKDLQTLSDKLDELEAKETILEYSKKETCPFTALVAIIGKKMFSEYGEYIHFSNHRTQVGLDASEEVTFLVDKTPAFDVIVAEDLVTNFDISKLNKSYKYELVSYRETTVGLIGIPETSGKDKPHKVKLTTKLRVDELTVKHAVLTTIINGSITQADNVFKDLSKTFDDVIKFTEKGDVESKYGELAGWGVYKVATTLIWQLKALKKIANECISANK